MTNFRAPAEMLIAIDRAIADQATACSRSEFIRRLLADHLREKGYLPPIAGEPSP